ncbi:efflux RND transporter periplasmic adaptor subunit [Flavobacterium tegetincola]|uniref:efflux RND transporter periplasmic adaptor subunit n=1 Tax=Flavobacterium tegetincola TaxID=150172 RepID=UPI0003FF6C73|nr:efflux RND transporter periplasmic adaptor subunit [Flavobacterium tegetincola]
MKKIISLSVLAFALYSCGDQSTKDVETVIATNDLKQINEKRDQIHQDYEKLAAQMALLDAAIIKLDDTKRYPLVKTMTVIDSAFTHYIELQGNVDTKENILIYPEYSGILTALNVKSGQKVSKGQVLARIDDGGMSAQLAQAENKLALDKTTFDRQKNLWNQKIGSEIQYLQTQTAYQSQQKMVKQMQAQLSKTVVRAPFSGTIDEVLAERGQVVAPGQELFRIVNLGNMYVTANVPENYLSQLKLGATVEVYLNAIGKTYKGKVRQVGTFINPNNRTFGIEIAVPNPDNLLRPNQVAVLKIEDYTSKNALLIPENIISENALNEKIVYVITNEKEPKVAQRIIEVGYASGALVEVKSGLKPGEIIVTDGGKALSDGAAVEIIK